MPEGPEVETIRRSLEERLREQRIHSIWRSDFMLRSKATGGDFQFLVGKQIQSLSRLGKMLILDTEANQGLFIHFGMSGKLSFVMIDSPLEPHTHLRMQFARNQFELRFVDPRRFGDLKPFKNRHEREGSLSQLGPDAINFTPDQIKRVADSLRKSQRPIKVILLDQNTVSGVGNIYACEALHLAKISPLRKGRDLSLPAAKRLLVACQTVMTKAVANKGTSFMSYLDGNGDKGENQNHLRVFAKENEPCPVCRNTIIRMVQSGRSTFYCRVCQT